jgi:AbrB family looped-hinge helix DNA binding protein
MIGAALEPRAGYVARHGIERIRPIVKDAVPDTRIHVLDAGRSVHYTWSNAHEVRGRMMATVTRKGQVTLPRDIRRALGIEAGTEIDFELQADGALLRKRAPREAFEHWRGYLQTHGIDATTDELMAELRDQ